MSSHSRFDEARELLLYLGLLLALLFLIGATPALAGKAPPAGRTYFTVVLGLEEPFVAGVDCVRFKRARICHTDGSCGTWARSDDPEVDFTFRIEIAGDGESDPIVVERRALIEERAEKDAFAASCAAGSRRKGFNYALAGRAVGRKQCQRLVDGWRAAAALREVLR